MKRALATAAVLALLVFVGCDKGTPGGPGVTSPGQKAPVFKEGEDTFTLHTPALATHLKQGEAKEIDISIKRGKNFDQDVALKFENLPKGVTIEPASPTIKHGDADVKVKIKATDDAALGDHTIKVEGAPTKGATATHDLKVTVAKK
jgi:uncharacterized membrane protein